MIEAKKHIEKQMFYSLNLFWIESGSMLSGTSENRDQSTESLQASSWCSTFFDSVQSFVSRVRRVQPWSSKYQFRNSPFATLIRTVLRAPAVARFSCPKKRLRVWERPRLWTKMMLKKIINVKLKSLHQKSMITNFILSLTWSCVSTFSSEQRFVERRC